MLRWLVLLLVIGICVWFFLPGVEFQVKALPEIKQPSLAQEAISVTAPTLEDNRRAAAAYRRMAHDILANKRASKADRNKAQEYIKRANALEHK